MTVEGFCLKDCQRVNSHVTFFYRQPPYRNLTAVQGLNFSVPRQKLRVCETGSLGKLGEKVPTSSPAPMLLKEPCETGNVYAPDPEKECFRSHRAHILNSEVVIDCVLNRYSVCGFVMCLRADLLCTGKVFFFLVLFSREGLQKNTKTDRTILTIPFLLKLNALNYVVR